jgi:hypothetical protein
MGFFTGDNMDCFEYERFIVNKAFLALFAVHTGKIIFFREKV